ncbi:MAG: hypothetical protein HYX25_02840 [Candidatus Solibacter usitatus]|nr:hypothetical protein [Candidatus Solibacter usitatus]
MSGASDWGWPALFFLGAYHGLNPGMGWLFAVALGMQEKSSRAVVRSLAPIALGHAAAIGVVLALASAMRIVLPLQTLKYAIAAGLVALGVYRLIRHRHFKWVGMQVGFVDLTLWSFLMASAHGAGLMVLPVVMGMPAGGGHAHHTAGMTDPLTGAEATLVHSLGYLILTALIALIVYQKVGLAMLRKAWLNLDQVWAVALIVTGLLALAI